MGLCDIRNFAVMKKKKKKTKKSAHNLRLWIWVSVAMVLSALAGGAGVWYYIESRTPYEGSEDVRIYIPRDATTQSVCDTLTTHLGSYGQQVAKFWRWHKGSPAKAEGSYLVTPGMGAKRLSDKLSSGNQDPVKVTFNNIRTLDQLAERIARQMEMQPADFIAACDSILPQHGYNKYTYPAAFLPDTYEFYWSAAPTTVVERLMSYRDKWWTPERKALAANIGLDEVQVYTLGAIVDEETAKADEKPKVARLYLNRLDKNMRLQADPTVKFAFGDFKLRRITHQHLATESPYNTYLHEGLPPGPIRLVPASTLEAVLNAPKHDYIYMCAKEDFSGYHNFAVTAAEHSANARRYHEELNRRNIK